MALVRLFGIQMEPLLSRVNRLPEKALVEYLRIAGVTPLPATAAEALLIFTVAPAAGASVPVPAGFQAGAAPATGSGDQVIFETERAVTATPATAGGHRGGGERGCLRGGPCAGRVHRVRAGARPGQRTVDRPGRSRRSGQPGPVAVARRWWPRPRRGRRRRPSPRGEWRRCRAPAPLVSWAVLDGGTMAPATLPRDETGGLSSGGIVELERTRAVAAGPPARLGRPARSCCWLRALLEYGEYPAPPVFSAVLVNAVRATATRTIRDEPLVTAAGQPGRADPDAAEPDPGRSGQRSSSRWTPTPGGDVFGTTARAEHAVERGRPASAITARRPRCSPWTTPPA